MTQRRDRQAWLPPHPQDFIVTVRGRERPWLSRILGVILTPLFRWRLNRRLRKARHGDGAA